MDRSRAQLQTVLYVLVLVVGISFIALAVYQDNDFVQALLLGLGTDMVVVTLVFLIFNAFGPRKSAHSLERVCCQLAKALDEIESCKRRSRRQKRKILRQKREIEILECWLDVYSPSTREPEDL